MPPKTPIADEILDEIAHDLQIWRQQGPFDGPLLMTVEIKHPDEFLKERRKSRTRR